MTRSLLVALSWQLLLAGCSRYDEAIWSEEVKLHDGRTIIVERRATRQPSGFPVAPRGRELEVELRYPPLGVVWKDDGWNNPFSFELFEGVPHLVVYPRDPAHCSGKPDDEPLAVFLIWNGSAWTRVDKSAFPVKIARKNLHARYWGHGPADDAKGLITWTDKAREDGFPADSPKSVESWYTAGYTCALYRMGR